MPPEPRHGRKYGEYCNSVRLHSAIGYIAPNDLPADRDRKLEAARERRRIQRNAVAITEAAA